MIWMFQKKYITLRPKDKTNYHPIIQLKLFCMKKKLFLLLLFFVCISCGAFAQQPSGRIRLLDEGLKPTSISRNGKFITGFKGVGESTSFIWDENTGVNLISENYPTTEASAISDDGLTIAGLFPDSSYFYQQMNYDTGMYEDLPLFSAGYYKNEKWYSLGINPDLSPDENGYYKRSDISEAYDISADGTIVGGSWFGGKNRRIPVLWTNGIPDVLEYEEKEDGAKIQALSADASVKGGWASPVGVRTPVIWKNDNKIHYIIPENGRQTTGEVYGISANGKYAAMSIRSNAAIYNIEEDELTIIPILEGADSAFGQAVSDNGLVVGFCRFSTLREDRPFIYHEQFGTLSMEEFLEKQNIELTVYINWQMLIGISADGKRMTGFGYSGTETIGFIIDIEESLTGFNPARELKVKENGFDNFRLSWKKAHADDSNTLTGYNIYRNGTKINITPITVTTYDDNNLNSGMYKYTIKAVWNGSEESLPTREYVINNKKTTLPFFDEFNDLSPNTKGWNTELTEISGWEISGAGYPYNSIKYETPVSGEYSEFIATPYIDASGSEDVYLSFSYQPSRSEIRDNDFLKIEVYDGAGWNQVKELVAITEPGWDFEFVKINISEYAANKQIQVRFTAHGNNQSIFTPIWIIDNVRVYDAEDEIIAATPLNFTAHRANDYVYLSWTDPNESAYLTYINVESLFDMFGNYGETFIAANYYDEEDLKNIEGYTIRSISAYLTNIVPTSNPTYKLVAFKGTEKILEQTIESGSFDFNTWSTFELATPIVVDASKPLYYGIEVSNYDPSDHPVGLSGYPPVDGGANLISDDNGQSWKRLTSDFMNGSNWLIKAWMTKEGIPATTKPAAGLYGYMLYRNGEVVYGQDGSSGNVTLYNVFIDSKAPKDEDVCYELKAIYINGEESEMTSEVCLQVEGESIDNTLAEQFEIFPNPVKDELNINGEFKSFSIIDMRGSVLLSSEQNKINMSNIPAGTYLLKIETVSGVVIQKLIKQ